MKTLEGWYFVTDPFNGSDLTGKTKLPAKAKLHGTVWDHDGFCQGDPIVTSYVKEVKLADGIPMIVTVTGSVYKLGTVSHEHEKQFPNIAKRLYHLFNRGKSTPSIEINDWFVDNRNTVNVNGKNFIRFSFIGANGEVQKTDPIVGSYMVDDLILVKDKMGKTYKVNNPRSDYEALFPNARMRLGVKLCQVLPLFFI